jgi:hypothetical protein
MTFVLIVEHHNFVDGFDMVVSVHGSVADAVGELKRYAAAHGIRNVTADELLAHGLDPRVCECDHRSRGEYMSVYQLLEAEAAA